MLIWLLACGTISNDPFLEDLEYLAALPSEKSHTVQFEEEAQVEPEEQRGGPELFTYSLGVARECNAFIKALLIAVDYVRSLPPSSRTDTTRGWGPYPWNSVDLTVEIERKGLGEFDWNFSGDSGVGPEPFLEGTHYAGASVASGEGVFVWQHGLASRWTGTGEEGVLTVDYDNRDGLDLVVEIDGFKKPGEDPVDATYTYTVQDGLGDFQYRTDIVIDAQPVNMAVRTRFVVQGVGRADAIFTLENGVQVQWTQCWDQDLNLIYQWDDADIWQPVGTESACAWTDFAVVDRI